MIKRNFRSVTNKVPSDFFLSASFIFSCFFFPFRRLVWPYENRTPRESKEWANLAYDRTFRFDERRHYVYTFLVCGYLYARVGVQLERTRNRDKQQVGRKTTEREKKRIERSANDADVWHRSGFELFYSANIGPNQNTLGSPRTRI